MLCKISWNQDNDDDYDFICYIEFLITYKFTRALIQYKDVVLPV